MTCSFGDTDLAAERLRVLDTVFGDLADGVLADVPLRPTTVGDPGCGPGATTAWLLRHFPSAVPVSTRPSPSPPRPATRYPARRS